MPVTWSESGRPLSMKIRVQRRTNGQKDHLLVHGIDDASGQAQRLAKYEIARGKWTVKPGWGIPGPEIRPTLEQLNAVKRAAEALVSR